MTTITIKPVSIRSAETVSPPLVRGPGPTTWAIAIDWERDGTFSEAYDDVTARIISARWFLGERQPYQDTADDSMLTLVLNNSDRRFSPENGASPLAGHLTPFKPVRIQAHDGLVTQTCWLGWIESIQPAVNINGERTVEITAAGPMQFYKAAETALALQENMRTDDIIAALIKEVVIPPALTGAWLLGRVGNSELGVTTFLANTIGYSDLDEGATTLAIAADNWVSRGGRSNEEMDTFDVYQAIKDVVAAERGRFLFSREGKALFWNRHHLLQGEVAAASFDDTMTGLEYQYAGLEDFKNEVVVVCHPRSISPSDSEVLWQLDDDRPIRVGETRTIQAKYQDESGNRIGGKNVSVALDLESGSVAVTLDARASSATLTLTNTSQEPAVIASCVLQGQKITDFGRMEAIDSDPVSIVDYGRRTMRLNLPSVDDFEAAQNIATFELHRRSQPRGAVRSLALVSHGTQGGGQHAQQLARTLGDKICIQESQTGHQADYHIIGELHKLSAGASLWETTWYLEPAPDSYPWKLGVEGRSELGQTTVVTY